MKNKKHIIVTGGAGFIGSHISRRLLAEGYKVTILDNLSTGKLNNIPRQAEFIKIDLGQQDEYKGLEKVDCDAIFHLAGQSSGEWSFQDPLYDLRSHVLSTFLLLDWCKQNVITRFVYASSMSVYGDPDYLPVDEKHPLQPKTFYAAGKISAEAYIKLYQNLGINTTIFRLFSVYGPGQDLGNKIQGMASIYLSYLLEGKPILVKGSAERFRDFIYIDDVVGAWFNSLDNPATYGRVYNLATGKKTKVEELIEAIKEVAGNPDYPIEYADGTSGDQFGLVADISRIAQDLRWQPKVDLSTGIKKMFEFEKRRMEVAGKDNLLSL